jgi:membrane fusion protein (multidrug efflux system)
LFIYEVSPADFPDGKAGRGAIGRAETRMKREWIVGLGLALAFLSMTGCGAKPAAQAAAAPAPPPTVKVAPVVQRDVPVVQEWIGTTEGNVNAEIRPQVEGYLLRRVYAEGSLVRQGSPLFAIDPRQFRVKLDQARADLEQAEAQLAKARQDVARFTPLAAEKAISRQELDNATAAERVAKAVADSKRAAVAQASLDLRWTTVSSPITGIAGIAQQQVGNLVSPTTVLAVVSQVDPIRVLYPLAEQDYLRLQEKVGGQGKADAAGLDLVLSDGTVFPHKGRFLFSGRDVDVKTGTITTVALFPNPGNVLRPGQYAKVRAVSSVEKGALLVPQRAVNELQGTFQVAVVGADGKADVRAVETGPRQGSLWVIHSGLKPGERVVVEGFTRVKAGEPVRVQEVPAEAAAEPAGAASAGGGK